MRYRAKQISDYSQRNIVDGSTIASVSPSLTTLARRRRVRYRANKMPIVDLHLTNEQIEIIFKTDEQIYKQNQPTSITISQKKTPLPGGIDWATGYFHRGEKSSKPLGFASCWIVPIPKDETERETGFGPATSTLARLRSTN